MKKGQKALIFQVLWEESMGLPSMDEGPLIFLAADLYSATILLTYPPLC